MNRFKKTYQIALPIFLNFSIFFIFSDVIISISASLKCGKMK